MGTARSVSTSAPRCPASRMPVHVIAFTEDVEAPPQDGEELARLIPGARFHLLEGMGHGS
jgi:pimeloyl-ACP methyl ester carboxylesterase